MKGYREFLESKIETAPVSGFEIDGEEINKALKPHQRDAVLWALSGGRLAQEVSLARQSLSATNPCSIKKSGCH